MPHGPQIPLTPQTDERNFPRWEEKAPPGHSGHPYPRMLTRRFTHDDAIEWRQRNKRFDRNTREEYYESRHPNVGQEVNITATREMVEAGFPFIVGQEIVVDTKEDEAKVLEFLGLKDKAAPVAPATVSYGLGASASVERENEELRRQIADLKMRTDKPKRGGRPKGSRNKPKIAKTLSPEQMAQYNVDGSDPA